MIFVYNIFSLHQISGQKSNLIESRNKLRLDMVIREFFSSCALHYQKGVETQGLCMWENGWGRGGNLELAKGSKGEITYIFI